MEIDGARTLVAGATGVLGSALAAALRREGARVAVAGRSERIADDPQAFHFDALDLDRCAAVVDAAADALGGLDLLVVAFGVAAFGRPGRASTSWSVWSSTASGPGAAS